jgi:hypothetical protein
MGCVMRAVAISLMSLRKRLEGGRVADGSRVFFYKQKRQSRRSICHKPLDLSFF